MDFDAIVTGDREVAVHFAQFPQRLHDKLLERIQKLTMKLYVRVVQLAPMDSAAPSGLHLPQEFVSIIKNHTDSIEGVVTMPKGLPQREHRSANDALYEADVASFRPSRHAPRYFDRRLSTQDGSGSPPLFARCAGGYGGRSSRGIHRRPQ